MSDYNALNLAERSRRMRPKTGGVEKRKPLKNDDDDIFKDILSDVKQSFNDRPQTAKTNVIKKPPKKDEFELLLEEENKRMEREMEEESFNFKDDPVPPKKNISTTNKSFEEDTNIDDVLLDLDLGVQPSNSMNSKNNSSRDPLKKEKDPEYLKKKRKMLFSGGDEEEDKPEPKPKSLLDKSKREELNNSGNIRKSENTEERHVKDLSLKPPVEREKPQKLNTSYKESAELESEEIRILKNQVATLNQRIETLTKDKDDNEAFMRTKHSAELEKLNKMHNMEMERLRKSTEYDIESLRKQWKEDKERTSQLASIELTTTTKNFQMQLETQKKYYESQMDSYTGLKKTNHDLTSMSDNVRSNLDELKCIVQEIKFYKNKDEQEEDTRYNQKQDVLLRFEQSLSDRVKDLDRQKEIVDSLRKSMEEQMNNNNSFFTEERLRLKEKQNQMNEMKSKYEEVINTQKDLIMQEQVKVKKLEDECQLKEQELKRRSENHEDNVRRQMAEIESRKNELVRYKENLEDMYNNERKSLDDERITLRKDRETLFSEKLSVEELANEVRREKEALDIERKNYDTEKSRYDEEKDYITKIAISMEQKSLQISQRDNEINQERAELENLKFELERDKTRLKSDSQALEQKRQDLLTKTKAFEKMRFDMTKEMNTFEEEKSCFYKTNTYTPSLANTMGKMERTTQFINETTKLDKDLFKREVSPIKITSRGLDETSGRFNYNSYIHDLERRYNDNSKSEYLLKENQDLIKQKFETSGYDPILRNESKMYQSVNVHDRFSGSSISLSARNNKNTPITLKSIDVISATDLNSEQKNIRELN